MPGIWSGFLDRFFDSGSNRQGPFDGDYGEGDFRFMFEEAERMMAEMERLSSLHGFGMGNVSVWEDNIEQGSGNNWLHSPSLQNVGQGKSLREQFLRQPPSSGAPSDTPKQPANPSASIRAPVSDWRANNNSDRGDGCLDCDSRRNIDPVANLFGTILGGFPDLGRGDEVGTPARGSGFFNFSMQTSRRHQSDGVVTTETFTRGSDGREVTTRTTIQDGQKLTVTEERHPDGTVTRTENSDPANVRFERGFLPESQQSRPKLTDTPDRKESDVPYGGRLWNEIFSDSRSPNNQKPWWKLW